MNSSSRRRGADRSRSSTRDMQQAVGAWMAASHPHRRYPRSASYQISYPLLAPSDRVAMQAWHLLYVREPSFSLIHNTDAGVYSAASYSMQRTIAERECSSIASLAISPIYIGYILLKRVYTAE